MKPEALEERIRHAMSTRTLTPGTEAWETIASRRHRGEEIDLLPARNHTRRIVAILAIAAALALLITPLVQRSDSPASRPVATGAPDTEGDNPFMPASLMAQTSDRPAFHAATGFGRGLREGRWTYGGGRADGPPAESFRYDLIRSTYEGAPAWLMVSGFATRDSGWKVSDSLYATTDEFAPRYRVFRGGNGSRIEHTYRKDEVVVGTTLNGYTSWAVKQRRDTADDTRNGGRLRQQDLGTQLRSLPLAADWKGSVPIPTENDTGIASIWLNLAVDGEEEIITPAGRFLCWRIRTAHPDGSMPRYDPVNPEAGIYFWISKERGWLVQTIFANPGKTIYRQILTAAEEK